MVICSISTRSVCFPNTYIDATATPLAGATAIMFSSPIFATLASAYFLHEKVGPTRWAVLLVGFLGVLVIASPGADSFQIGALFALGNAVLFGTVVAGVRGMAATESTATLIMYQLTLLTVCLCADAAVRLRHAERLRRLHHDRSAGSATAMAQYLWTRAIHLAPTSAVVPFQYLQLVWAILLGFAIWGDLPTVGLLIGSAIVIASGMYLFWREIAPRAGGRAGHLTIELLVVAPDAPLAERDAPLRREIRRDARALRDAVAQRDHARDLLLEPLHALREAVAQALDDLEQAEIDISELAAEQEMAAAARQNLLEVAEEFRHAIAPEIPGAALGRRNLLLEIEPAGHRMMRVVDLDHQVRDGELQLVRPQPLRPRLFGASPSRGPR